MGQNEQRALLVAIAALGFSTLALASAPRWAACVSAALAILAVVPLAGSRRVLAGPRPLLSLLAIPLVATALQLLPLPAALVQVLAPARFALAEANAHAYGHTVSSLMPLSQDWPATLVELAKFCGYFAFAYVCTRLCVSSRVRHWLLVSVCAVGGLVAVCALGHRVLGMKTLLGLYKPTVAYSQAISPFFNPNHLAGYMAFVTPLCLGLAAQRRSWPWLAAATVCAFTAVQAVSRGGIVSLSLGLVVTLFLLAIGQNKRSSNRSNDKATIYWVALGLGLVFVGFLIFGATAGHQLLALDFQREQDAGKFLAWGLVPDLVAESPWVGIGRGAFEFSFTRFQPATGVTFSHIENEYLQAVIDWGLPAAAVMLIAVGLLLRSLLRRGTMDAMAAGGFGALAALLVQNTVDFGLEMPGVALPAIAVVATLLPGKLVVQADKVKRKLAQGVRLGAVVVAMLVCALAASSLGAPPSKDISTAPEFAAGYRGESEHLLAAASRIARRHPSSYLLAARTANSLWEREDPKAFSAMARALALNSSHPGVHLLAAEMLASSQQPRQAIAEYRAAMEISGPRLDVLKRMEAHFPAVADLLLVIPEDREIASRFGPAFLRMERPDVAEAFARLLLQQGQAPFAVYQSGVRAAVLNGHFSWAVETATLAHQSYGSEESLLLHVAALRAASLPLLAIQVLVEANGETKVKSLRLLDILSTLQLEVKELAAARQTTELLLQAAGASLPVRKIAHNRLATIEEQMGNKHQADWHRQQAVSLRQR